MRPAAPEQKRSPGPKTLSQSSGRRAMSSTVSLRGYPGLAECGKIGRFRQSADFGIVEPARLLDFGEARIGVVEPLRLDELRARVFALALERIGGRKI